MPRSSFLLYFDMYDSIRPLTIVQKAQLLDAMFLYHRGEDLPELDPVVSMCFSFLSRTFDMNRAKYEQLCEKNRENVKTRWEKKDTIEYGRIRPHTSGYDPIPSDTDTDSDTGITSLPSLKPLPQDRSTAFPLHAGKSQGSPDGSLVGGELEEPEGKPKRFTPPSLEELSAYLNAKGSSIDPEAFIAYYDSKGWMIGKSKMKSWKAAVVTWEKKRAQDRGPEDTSWQTYRPWSKAYLERRKPMHKDTPRATKEEIDAGAKVIRSLITPDDYESEIVALTISWLLDDPGRCVHVKSLRSLADEVPVWGRIISWASNGARGAKVCENPWEGAE